MGVPAHRLRADSGWSGVEEKPPVFAWPSLTPAALFSTATGSKASMVMARPPISRSMRCSRSASASCLKRLPPLLRRIALPLPIGDNSYSVAPPVMIAATRVAAHIRVRASPFRETIGHRQFRGHSFVPGVAWCPCWSLCLATGGDSAPPTHIARWHLWNAMALVANHPA